MGKKHLKKNPLLSAVGNESVTHEIGVCGGYSCRMAGAREIRNLLDREVWRQKLDDKVRVCTVGCLDQCREGPNVGLRGHPLVVTRVRAADVERVLDRLIGLATRRPPGRW